MTSNINTAPFWLDPDEPELFPDVELALSEPDGLLAVGGDLSPERLKAAYRNGIFPWYSEGQIVMWWSPNPRALLFLDELIISRSLRKSLKRSDYEVSFDTRFSEVIEACATSRKDGMGTWIVDDMKRAYGQLHESGIAHSVEVCRNGELVGGLYGVSIGSCFFGESMFSRQTDTSKIALVYLTRHLQKWNFPFIDCQVYSEHLGTLGAREVPRPDFVRLLDEYCQLPTHTGPWQCEFTAQTILNNNE